MQNARQLPSLTPPAESDDAIESLARRSYEGCHPNDFFDALKRRAVFNQVSELTNRIKDESERIHYAQEMRDRVLNFQSLKHI